MARYSIHEFVEKTQQRDRGEGVFELESDRMLEVNLDGKIYFHKDAVEAATSLLRNAFEEKEGLSLSDFRVLLDTTRKFAMPLLNYFDNNGITVRSGDIRQKGPLL